jgi:hypothetical protein
LIEQILSYKTLFFDIVITIGYALFASDEHTVSQLVPRLVVVTPRLVTGDDAIQETVTFSLVFVQ